MESNLDLYNRLRNVPKEAQKNFNNGRFSGTDINPMWRIKKLTEEFGVAGFGWYTEIVKRDIIEASDGTKCAFIALNLYVKVNDVWSKPIYGEGGNTFEANTRNGKSVTDEAFKMAYTDALGIAAKALGLCADVWFANDQTKYTAAQPSAPAPQPKPQPKPQPAPQPKLMTDMEVEQACGEFDFCQTKEQATDVWVKYPQLQKDSRFIQAKNDWKINHDIG